MIKFINALTGTEMLVADERRDEYLAAGHRLAVRSPEKKAEKADPIKQEPKKEYVKAPARKSAQQRKK